MRPKNKDNGKAKSRRKIEPWMTLTKREILNLTEENWLHYKKGGCLCSAYSDDECICGAWRKVKTVRKYEVGDFVSIWNRDSKRHKWRLEKSYALLTRITDEDFSIQTHSTHSYYQNCSWQLAGFRGDGTWERKLDKPIFDVRVNQLERT